MACFALCSQIAPTEGGNGSGAEQNPPQFFALTARAVLAVVPMGGSAVFFVLVNTRCGPYARS